ncbi:MAG: hypothetical protein NG712_01035 [Omnitrophica bacterium]|nr:hypothetical protein [Candidatus Omnitrophota bacterium]
MKKVIGIFFSIYLLFLACCFSYAEEEFYEKVLFDTSWVKQEFPIYFAPYAQDLRSINIDGTELKEVFETKYPVQEYQFSPDGKYLNILTYSGLEPKEAYLLDRETNQPQLLEIIAQGTLQWAPDNQRFLYRSRDYFYIYNYLTKEREKVLERPFYFTNIYWDETGENLYFMEYQRLDQGLFHGKLFRLPLATREAELLREADTGKAIFQELLKPLEIELFNNEKNRFRWGKRKRYSLTLESGQKLYQDEAGDLYYQDAQGHQQRLFAIPRDYLKGFSYIYNFRWIPGGKYVIMQSETEIFILEPSTGKVGKLTDGNAFGWYKK